MALSREEAAAYAASEFQELLADAGIDTTETGGLKGPLDRAMRSTGLAVTDSVPDGSEASFLLVLDWAVLSRIERALALRVDVSVDGPSQSKKYSQAADHVRQLREDAWVRAQPFISEDASPDDWEVGTVSLGILALPPEGAWW